LDFGCIRHGASHRGCGDRLESAEGVHWRAAYPCHYKSVNRIPDNFLPKTRGGRMMGKLRDWRTIGLGLKEKISDGYPKTIGPPDWARFIGSGAQRRPGWATAALDDEKTKNLTPIIARNPLKRLNSERESKEIQAFPTP
jgi:hypothetical protein